jgi:hypothetical protein
MDNLKQSVVQGALDGAIAGIRRKIGGSHDIEVVTAGRLERQVRVRNKRGPDDPEGFRSPGPRYFLVKVSEPI